MELVLDVVSAPQWGRGLMTSKSFRQAGGVIGRGEHCEWVILDPTRQLSKRHAQVSFHDGTFYMTDISSNGISLKGSDMPLAKGRPHRVEHGSCYRLAGIEIRARLLQAPSFAAGEPGQAQASTPLIPDDAFLDDDPIAALEQHERGHAEVDELSAMLRADTPLPQQRDYAPITQENLLLPNLVVPGAMAPPPSVPEPKGLPPSFWEQFGEALGVPLDDLDDAARRALAVDAAKLLKRSIGHLQRALRTRSELKNELRLALTTVQYMGNNPLKYNLDSGEALGALLRGGKPGQLSGEQALDRCFLDLQAQPVALVAASRAAVRGVVAQLSPEQLTAHIERSGRKPLIATAASRWRAYCRMHAALMQHDEWAQQMFRRDFVTAYEEQIRLITTLHHAPQR
ncbi:type VI secretion system-associated FHA domain protein TagH [Pseudomonas typographi]|uniref:type VI secretion system-associated FHA domain protein TagH n=1 Tax=Pseudomonas typographi TaxID=2715964 RepID=UPI0016840AEA|nr:type VI secretion system-associated FHA domain protein TagH [Pseudomonas typographi]MBD1553199.1 type VI secretion system-associated FHA domain protein TagH [Pseudomonas typographi]MBD1588079.1 type VI secretion system-associated FHA domain protein TagH [Pseudomonas typographi]